MRLINQSRALLVSTKLVSTRSYSSPGARACIQGKAVPLLVTPRAKCLIISSVHILQPATDFFEYRIVFLQFFKLTIKARHEIGEFLYANL